jgi:hypothetical protein
MEWSKAKPNKAWGRAIAVSNVTIALASFKVRHALVNHKLKLCFNRAANRSRKLRIALRSLLDL